jgi:YegS/Rv2252/BmrU family lipid kinase
VKRKIAFILHGKTRNIPKIISQLSEIFNPGFILSFHVTQYAYHAAEISYSIAKEGVNYIIAVGGDGTLNEVVNGVMKAKNEGLINNDAWNSLKIGLLPRGTGNDFAKTIRVNFNFQSLKEWIETDSYTEIDLGLADYQNTRGQSTSRYVINITDLGLGGIIAHKLSGSSKLFGATFTYQAIIISSLLGYRNKLMKIKADGFDYEGKVMSLVVANGKYFGAGLGVAPEAVPNDGLFSVVIIGEISLFDYLKNLGRIRKCQRVDHPQLKYYSAKEIGIESGAEQLPIDMDGEFVGYSSLKINIVPKALKFIAPQ